VILCLTSGEQYEEANMTGIKKSALAIFTIALIVVLSKTALADGGAAEYIVKLKDEAQIALMSEDSESVSEQYGLEECVPEHGIYVTDSIDELDRDMFEYIEENVTVELFGTYDYTNLLKSETYSNTAIESMWNIGVYGAGVRVGVIDSGCNAHKALSANVVEGINLIDGSTDVTDNVGHGTSVCGVIAAAYDSSVNGKVVGTAHKAEIVPLKFTDSSDSGLLSNIVAGIYAAVDDFDCDVINMSCGTSENVEALKTAVSYAAKNGVILVAAAGNDASSAYNYPATYSKVIGVGSVDSSKNHSSFSNTNISVFVCAPGESVALLSPTRLSSTATGSGTSFSSPYVAGIIADMLAINPDLTLSDIKTIISETAEDLGDDGYDTEYGWGLIRADNIVEYMLAGCEYFTAGVDLCTEDDYYEMRLRLNGADLPAFLLAEYENGTLVDMIFDTSALSGDDNIVLIRVPYDDSITVKGFVWDSLGGIMPVSNIGIYPDG
ncbi:MAG: S8 family serine peptidase, partial [Firmicutes bacterium]|nr:S8 family serine peptidase [Bacillota bacterium]